MNGLVFLALIIAVLVALNIALRRTVGVYDGKGPPVLGQLLGALSVWAITIFGAWRLSTTQVKAWP
jgi:hypothetical protein